MFPSELNVLTTNVIPRLRYHAFHKLILFSTALCKSTRTTVHYGEFIPGSFINYYRICIPDDYSALFFS